MIVVYKAHPGPELDSVMKLLRKAHLNPVVLDNMDPVLIHKSGFLTTVRVAVAPEHVNRAKQILKEQEIKAAPVVRSLNQLFITQLIISVVLGLCVAGVMGGFGHAFEQCVYYGFGMTVATR